jgi:hypothetical protein
MEQRALQPMRSQILYAQACAPVVVTVTGSKWQVQYRTQQCVSKAVVRVCAMCPRCAQFTILELIPSDWHVLNRLSQCDRHVCWLALSRRQLLRDQEFSSHPLPSWNVLQRASIGRPVLPVWNNLRHRWSLVANRLSGWFLLSG